MLHVDRNFGKECHGPVPTMLRDFIRIWPFDSVVIDVSDFIANKKVLGSNKQFRSGRVSGRSHSNARSPSNAGDGTRLLKLEARYEAIEYRHEAERTVGSPKSEDTLLALGGRKGQRRQPGTIDRATVKQVHTCHFRPGVQEGTETNSQRVAWS